MARIDGRRWNAMENRGASCIIDILLFLSSNAWLLLTWITTTYCTLFIIRLMYNAHTHTHDSMDLSISFKCTIFLGFAARLRPMTHHILSTDSRKYNAGQIVYGTVSANAQEYANERCRRYEYHHRKWQHSKPARDKLHDYYVNTFRAACGYFGFRRRVSGQFQATHPYPIPMMALLRWNANITCLKNFEIIFDATQK